MDCFSGIRSPFVIALILWAVCSRATRADERQSDWSHQVPLAPGEQLVELFNGHDLSGWEGLEKHFTVVGHQIRAASDGPVPSSTYLFTKQKYRNFRLLFEIKQTVGEKYSPIHSAIAALGKQRTQDGGGYGFEGPLFLICNEWGLWDAHGRNIVVPRGPKTARQNKSWEKRGSWNQIEMLVVGNRIRLVSNGMLAMDYTDQPSFLKNSPIGLQLHNSGAAQEYHFRGLVLVDSPADQLLTLKAITR